MEAKNVVESLSSKYC